MRKRLKKFCVGIKSAGQVSAIFGISLVLSSAPARARETVGGSGRAVGPSNPALQSVNIGQTVEEKHERELNDAIASGDLQKVFSIARNPSELDRAVNLMYVPEQEANLLPSGTDVSSRPVKIEAYVHPPKGKKQHLVITWTDENGQKQRKEIKMSAGKGGASELLVRNCFDFQRLKPGNEMVASGATVTSPSWFRGKRTKGNGEIIGHDAYAIHGLLGDESKYNTGESLSHGCFRVDRADAEFIQRILKKAGRSSSVICVY